MIKFTPKYACFLESNNIPYSYQNEALTVFDKVITVDTVHSWIRKKKEPGYYFVSVDLSHRKHRYNFTRHSLTKKGFDKDQHVDEILGKLKYRKIYNSGNLLFKKTF